MKPPICTAGNGEFSTPPLILLIEDDPQIRRLLRGRLTGQGYRLAEATTADEGLATAVGRRPDLVLLELVLPDLDGLEVIRRIRERSQTPIIVLSARGDERDKIQALDKGADDYISKPFAVGEVLARVRVGLRHGAPAGQTHVTQVFAVGDLRIDLVRRRVTVRGATLHLSPIEYRLLAALVRHAGNLVTQRQLLEEVWGPGYVGQPHYLRVYAGHLRRKLEADPARPRYLLTEPRVGYRLVVD